MSYVSKKLFLRKAAVLLTLLSVIPQIICLAVRYVNGYYSGSGAFPESVSTVLDEAVSAVGTLSTFCAYAVTVYCAVILGVKWGSEWLIALIAAFVTCYAIMYFSGSYLASLALMAFLVVLGTVYYVGRNAEFRGISVLTAVLTALPYPAAVLIYAVSGSGTAETVLTGVLYGTMNLGLDLLVLVLAAQAGRYFHFRYAQTGCDLTVGGRFLPKGCPVLKADLAACLIYTGVALAMAVTDTVSSFSDYGVPASAAEWLTELYPYAKLVLMFALGYSVTVFVSNRLEDYYFEAVDTDERLNGKRRKTS